MNENHPFAERKELHMSELAGEKFVFLGILKVEGDKYG